MVFSSFQFVLAFLPVSVIVYMLLQRYGFIKTSSWWLTLASLFFYAWWDYRYLFIPLGSVVFNYFVGKRLLETGSARRGLLIFGITANLLLLGVYKYAGFAAENLVALFGLPIGVPHIALPLAISFCTFQQISFLVDCHRKQVAAFNFRRYLLYIVFFPHLIAGPVVRHHELMPQLEVPHTPPERWRDITKGLHLFVIGLFKKAVFADAMAGYADPVFNSVAAGSAPNFLEAWGGALAYTFQLYFDFSGYADMAMGAALMLGIILPQNFDSPYKAQNIADFWRRWHITLSHFLRDYLYIPLGGSRKGAARTVLNLFVTMLLGGLWHGAAWTYVLWGAAHGAALAVCHVWRNFSKKLGWSMPRAVAYALTFLFVIVCWVVFRAPNMATAGKILSAMFGGAPLVMPEKMAWLGSVFGNLTFATSRNLGSLPDPNVFLYSLLLFLLCKYAPNSRQWVEERGIGSPETLTLGRCVVLSVLIAVCMVSMLAHKEVFIYYVF